MRKACTAKQEAFAVAYVGEAKGDATAALRIAYPNTQKWADAVAYSKAHQIRTSPLVSARIQELRDKAADVAVLDAAQVLRELKSIVLFDPAALFDAEGNLLPLHKMPANVRAGIASIEVEETKIAEGVATKVKKIKVWDKNSAIEKAMKHLGQFEKDNRQKPSETRFVILNA